MRITSLQLLDVLAQMGSVSCIVVWACECYAFIRFWKYLHLHNEDLKQQKARYLIRSNYEGDGELYGYPYRSTGQPLTAYLALTACLFILVVANGATLWRGIPHISGTSRSDSVGTFLAKCFAAYLAVSRSYTNLAHLLEPSH
jgi:amino acid permease